jgi:hypothetical protein
MELERRTSYRPHAVCVVQNFKHAYSGYMLYLFVRYWQRLGWTVIVYDMFGAHLSHVSPLLSLPGVHYHPYTLLQLILPGKIQASEYLNSTDYKYYYSREHKSDQPGVEVSSAADLDSDKAKTYDYCRFEYASKQSVLFVGKQ